MPESAVGQIEQGRPVGRPRVHDFEDSLQTNIEIDNRPGSALEHQPVLSRVPPAMGYSPRQPNRLARLRLPPPAAEHEGEGAGNDDTFFVLIEVDVQRWALPLRREGAPDLQNRDPVLPPAPKPENFANVPVFPP